MKHVRSLKYSSRLSVALVTATLTCAAPAFGSGHSLGGGGLGGIGGGLGGGLGGSVGGSIDSGGASASVGADVGGNIGGTSSGIGGGISGDVDVDVGFGSGTDDDTGGGTGGGTGGSTGGGTGGNTGGDTSVDVDIGIGTGTGTGGGTGGTVTVPGAGNPPTAAPNMRRVVRMLSGQGAAPAKAILPIALDEMEGLPVVDRRGKMLGMISTADLTNGNLLSLTISIAGELGLSNQRARVTVSSVQARRGAIWLPLSRDAFVGSLG